MTLLVRFSLVLLGCFVLFGPDWLAAQDKKDPPASNDKKDPPKPADDPFKLKKKELPPDERFKLKKEEAPDPFKLKKKGPGKDDPSDPFKLKSKDPKEDSKLPPPEDYPYYQQALESKLLNIRGELGNEFTIEYQIVDKEKVAKFQEWQTKQLFNIGSSKTPKEQFDRTMDYQKELPKRSVDIYSPKQLDVRAAEKIRVRHMDPPQEYDDRGFLKQWTPKELAAMKGNTKMPGYPVTLEALKTNQKVHVFLVPAPRSKEKKRRNDDDPPAPKELPEAVLIVIHSQK